MIPMNLDRVRQGIRAADTEDLLDRVTVYRAGMEPEALAMIEDELRERGIRCEKIAEHAGRRENVIRDEDGTARMCSFCRRPAIDRRRSWHRMWGILPIFRRTYYYCEMHLPPRN